MIKPAACGRLLQTPWPRSTPPGRRPRSLSGVGASPRAFPFLSSEHPRPVKRGGRASRARSLDARALRRTSLLPDTLRTFMPAQPSSKLAAFRERTRLVHAGRDPSEQHGFVNTPIYRGSTVLYPTTDDLLHRRGRYSYGTKGTPTIEALEEAWTELTGAAGTVLAPSGLAAVTLALMSCLKAGDHLL